MHEIDLVPESYRRGLALRRSLVLLAWAYLAAALCIGAARICLSIGIHRQVAALSRTQTDEAGAAQLVARYDALHKSERLLSARLDALRKLRGGPTVTEMFLALDRALDGRVWFEHLAYTRSGEAVKPHAGEKPADVIVVPAASGQRGKRAWRVQSRLDIQVETRDYASLAAFVQRLAAQPAVRRVRVLETRTRNSGGVTLVDSDLVVLLRARPPS